LLPQVVSFKYLGVFFDAGLRWGTQARYVQKRCLQRLIFFKSIASIPDLLLWNGQGSYATIEKGSVSRDKDSSGTHVFDP
jgi:hypothetical protein